MNLITQIFPHMNPQRSFVTIADLSREKILYLIRMAQEFEAFPNRDLLENRIVEQGYLPEPKKKAFEGAPRISSAYKRLVELGDALMALIRRSQGRDNKTLADFADSLRKILEKFKF